MNSKRAERDTYIHTYSMLSTVEVERLGGALACTSTSYSCLRWKSLVEGLCSTRGWAVDDGTRFLLKKHLVFNVGAEAELDFCRKAKWHLECIYTPYWDHGRPEGCCTVWWSIGEGAILSTRIWYVASNGTTALFKFPEGTVGGCVIDIHIHTWLVINSHGSAYPICRLSLTFSPIPLCHFLLTSYSDILIFFPAGAGVHSKYYYVRFCPVLSPPKNNSVGISVYLFVIFLIHPPTQRGPLHNT
jgi:hypothetical protein